MKRLLALIFVGIAACAPALREAPVASSATSESAFDDFQGPAGTPPDGRYWDYDLVSSNGQLQAYTNSTDNVHLDGAGNLAIEAKPTSEGGYTSGRLVTRGKIHMLYGTLSARIKMPSGQGISPAFWLLGVDTDTVGWPQGGEIDMIEMPNTGTHFYTTLHGPWIERPADAAADYKVTSEGPIEDLTTDFHTYWITREPNMIVVGIDGSTMATFTPTSLTDNQQWVFEMPMYAILNIAIGDSAAGPPDRSTSWPATMLVDWFRWEPA